MKSMTKARRLWLKFLLLTRQRRRAVAYLRYKGLTNRVRRCLGGVGVGSIVLLMTIMLATRCFDELSWPATGYASLVVVLLVVGVACSTALFVLKHVSKEVQVR